MPILGSHLKYTEIKNVVNRELADLSLVAFTVIYKSLSIIFSFLNQADPSRINGTEMICEI